MKPTMIVNLFENKIHQVLTMTIKIQYLISIYSHHRVFLLIFKTMKIVIPWNQQRIKNNSLSCKRHVAGKYFEGIPTNVKTISKYFTHNKDSSEENESDYKFSWPLCSSQSESNNFSNNNVDSDNEPDQKNSFTELQEHNESQSSNNSPQIKSSKKRGMNKKLPVREMIVHLLLVVMKTRFKKWRRYFVIC